MFDIKGYATFQRIVPIDKGMSSDKKYYIETVTNEKLLLRIADISRYDKKKHEFEVMQRLAESGVPMSRPVDFGICDNGKSVYTLLTWCDGEEAETVLPKLPETMQYVLGVSAGRILRKIHDIPAPMDLEPWESVFNRRAERVIDQYKNCGVRIDGDEQIFAFLEENRKLLLGRPQCFQHGDYHARNMIVSPDGKLAIIDFHGWNYGDPWEEFNRLVWSAAVSPHFATGQIHGYFDGNPPELFFRLLAFYMSIHRLSSIPWAIPYGEGEVASMLKEAKDVLTSFDGMRNPVPTWYLADFYIQYIDGIPYKLKSPFDFSFMKKYGDVFKVYDDQNSGNIAFGVKNGERKYFIKFAGAPAEQYAGKPEDAIARLKSAVKIYQDLAHPNLIRLIQAEEAGGGFAAIFEWVDGECWGKMYPLSREKFLQMPDRTKLQVFNDILDFHIHVAQQGYVAIDFYDGSVMYDFGAQKTVICDIDLYAKRPYINTMGRMWGSSRFMSPEEFTLGAVIDEVTNVYTMGATAFALFGGEKDRSIEKWRLNEASYEVALKAVSDDRGKRQQSILEFKHEWEAARLE